MNRFINDDAKLRVGGRNAVRISIGKLENIIEKYINKYVDSEEVEAIIEDFGELDLCCAIPQLIEECDALRKDLKYDFSLDNCTCEEDDDEDGHVMDKYVGYHTLDNGLTYLGARVGGDEEEPLFIILYYDGSKLRGYTPTRGNMVNTETKSAFNVYNEDEYDKVLAKYGYDVAAEDGYCNTDKLINMDAIIEDIKSRIVVK